MFTLGFEKVANTECDKSKIAAIGNSKKKKHEEKESKKQEAKEHSNRRK